MYLFTDNKIENIIYDLENAGDIFKLLYYVKERLENNPRSGEAKRALNFATSELNGYIYDMEELYIDSEEEFDIDITSQDDWEPNYKTVRGVAPRYIVGVTDLPDILEDVSLEDLKANFNIDDWDESDKILKKLLMDHPDDLELSEPDLDEAEIEEDDPYDRY